MRSFAELIAITMQGHSLPDAILAADSAELVVPVDKIRNGLRSRLEVMRDSVQAALAGTWHPQIALDDKGRYGAYGRSPLSGALIWRASEIACAVSTCNASMGRIVAAPTAGSCGILPGLLFAWQDVRGGGDVTLLEGLIVAAGVGDIIASRATLAGASGGCQAECGSAVAMGAAALCHMEGGTPEQCANAAALTIKSILGLVCDPVCGLVEVPCIKRNSSLVALGAISADMSLAGIKSFIPFDEMVDAMGEVGKALPETLRETGRGGCARTLTGKNVKRELRNLHSSPTGGRIETKETISAQDGNMM